MYEDSTRQLTESLKNSGDGDVEKIEQSDQCTICACMKHYSVTPIVQHTLINGGIIITAAYIIIIKNDSLSLRYSSYS
jgi:hypothetical protein